MKKIFGHSPLWIGAVAAGIVFLGLAAWGLSLLQASELPNLLGFPAAATTSQGDTASTTPDTSDANDVPLFQYIEIVDSCNWSYVGTCVNMRSGPGAEYPVVMKLRTGVVLKVVDTVMRDGRAWYKIGFDEEIRYPERVTGDWYVAGGEYLRLFTDEGNQDLPPAISIMGSKRIVVNLSEEMLYAYDGDTLFMKEPISTGLDLTPTPLGTFIIYKKTPSRYMQGPIPGVSDQYYDLPGVPWDLYFSYGGAVIHGAYWHNHFGEPWSHGCVNLPPEKAKELYYWADLGTPVTIEK